MIDRKHYGLVAFPTSQAAARAEGKTNQAQLECRLIPVPPQISAGCGLALQFSLQERQAVAKLFRTEQLKQAGFYEVRIGEKRKKTVKPLKEFGDANDLF